MKKLLVVFAAAALLSACNGNSTKTESTSDSTSVTAPATDSSAAATTDTTSKMSADTTHKMSADTTKK